MYLLRVATVALRANLGGQWVRTDETGSGNIAANVMEIAPRWLVLGLVFLLVAANTFNIAADIAAMGESLSLVIGGLNHEHALIFAATSTLLQVFVRMDVVVVRDRLDAELLLRLEQDLVRDRAAERAHLAPAQVRQLVELRAVAFPHGQRLGESVVRDRRRQRGAARGRVFDAAHADVEIAALHRLVDGRVQNLHRPVDRRVNPPRSWSGGSPGRWSRLVGLSQTPRKRVPSATVQTPTRRA